MLLTLLGGLLTIHPCSCTQGILTVEWEAGGLGLALVLSTGVGSAFGEADSITRTNEATFTEGTAMKHPLRLTDHVLRRYA